MGDDHFSIFVDKAKYVTFEVLKKSLDPEVRKRIKSVSSITYSFSYFHDVSRCLPQDFCGRCNPHVRRETQ